MIRILTDSRTESEDRIAILHPLGGCRPRGESPHGDPLRSRSQLQPEKFGQDEGEHACGDAPGTPTRCWLPSSPQHPKRILESSALTIDKVVGDHPQHPSNHGTNGANDETDYGSEVGLRHRPMT